MQRIVSFLDNDTEVKIEFYTNDIKIGNKYLFVNVNGNLNPTFSSNNYEYFETEFIEFINYIQNEKPSLFIFDQSNCNDGTCDTINYAEKKLIFTTSYAQHTMSIIINITDENKELIISDLKTLQNNLSLSINKLLDYLKSVNPDIEENIQNEN